MLCSLFNGGIHGMIIKQRIKKKLHRRGYDIISFHDEISCEKGKFINIGSGNWYCPQWINLDIESDWYKKAHLDSPFVKYDIRTDGIPFDDNSIDAIYTSHVIEHVEDCFVQKMFSEAFRVMKKGGCLE